MKQRTILPAVVIVIGIALIAYALVRHTSMATSTRTLNLPVYGIALTVPGTLNDITLTPREEKTGTVLHSYIASGCDLGAFYQIKKDGIEQSGTSWTEATLKRFEFPTETSPAQVKEFTDFYLIFEPNPDTCATDEKGKTAETEQKLKLWNALVSAHYMN